MSAHVLFKCIKRVGGNRSLSPNSFNKFNNTGARMLDSIYHLRSKLLAFWREKVKMLPSFITKVMLLDSILPHPISSGNECDKMSLNIAIFFLYLSLIYHIYFYAIS